VPKLPGGRRGDVLEPVNHSITFRRITVVPVRFAVKTSAPPAEAYAWADPRRPALPTSSLLAKLVERVTGRGT
jgi:hypothetical protein